MVKEDKQLLLQDLFVRLPYGIIVKDEYGDCIEVNIYTANLEHLIDRISAGIVKMVLRPMSSMTKEERYEYFLLTHRTNDLLAESIITYDDAIELIDWLNAHHFDYRGLIEKGLAIEVTEKNNLYKE